MPTPDEADRERPEAEREGRGPGDRDGRESRPGRADRDTRGGVSDRAGQADGPDRGGRGEGPPGDERPDPETRDGRADQDGPAERPAPDARGQGPDPAEAPHQSQRPGPGGRPDRPGGAGTPRRPGSPGPGGRRGLLGWRERRHRRYWHDWDARPHRDGPDHGSGSADAFDEHVQDPALARALREVDLPGPVVPAWSPAEVRARGDRRRTRRRAAWSGSGLVAAALVGALIVGPLTPGRESGDATSRQEAASTAPARTPSPAPGSPTAPPGASASSAARAAAVTLDVDRRVLIAHFGNGAPDQEIPGVVSTEAAKRLTDVTAARVAAKEPQQPVSSGIAGDGGDYDIVFAWVVTLELPDGTAVLIGSSPTCTDYACPQTHLAHAMVSLFGESWAKVFFDTVAVGDTVKVTVRSSGAADKAAVSPVRPPAATVPPATATRRTSDPETTADPSATATSSPTATGTPTPTSSKTDLPSSPPPSGTSTPTGAAT